MKGIGNTPMIQLRHLVDADSAEIWIKWEGANPTGSMKDRMALSIVEGAEKRGELKPGGRVIDYTGGSTGSSLSMVCAARGYRARFVSSDAFAESKLQTMRAFGATVDVIPSVNRMITPDLILRCFARVEELKAEPNTFWADQFNNVDNSNAYHALADEVLEALDGRVDEFITGVGTGGSFTGTSQRLKERVPSVRCIPIEPANSRPIAGLRPSGGHRLEGMGMGSVPGIFNMDLVAEIISVTDEDAFRTARLLATKEGLFGGISSGANVWAAMQRARELGPGKRVVTIIVDSGLKYLGGDLYR